MKNEIEALKKENKRQTEVIANLVHQVLVAELKAHPDAKDCPNPEFLAKVIVQDNNFGANTDTGVLQAHLDAERRYPSSLTLETILAMMKSDPESAILLRPAAPKWTPPTFNPWMKEHWNMTIQGQVFKNAPSLAAKWEAEAKRRDAANA